MKRKYLLSEVAAIVFTCFFFIQLNPIKANEQQNKDPDSQKGISKLKLPSKSSLLSLLSLIASGESVGGKNPRENYNEHLANILVANQKFRQHFEISSNPSESETITPTVADAILTNLTVDGDDALGIRTNASEVINSRADSPNLAPAPIEPSSLQTEDTTSGTSRLTITISTRRPVSLSEAEILQISNIENNRRHAEENDRAAVEERENDLAAETAMKMMVKNNLGVEDAMKVMAAGKEFGHGAALQLMVENAAKKLLATNANEGGSALKNIARNGEQFMGADNIGHDAMQIAQEPAEKVMLENNHGGDAAMQMMLNQAGKFKAGNMLGVNDAMQMMAEQAAAKMLVGTKGRHHKGMGEKNFRVDDEDSKVVDNNVQNAAMQMVARALPNPSDTTPALSLNFDDTDSLHTLNDSVSESRNIWQTYETAEETTKKGRICFQCQPEIEASFRDPRITWICGGYNRARRSFKSMCMMHMRNCQDGTMFVKLHDNKCKPDQSDELIPHGKTFFYDYSAPLSFESGNDLFGESVPSEVEAVQMKDLYHEFDFFGRGRKKPQ